MTKQNWKRYINTTPAVVAWIVGILIVIALYFVIANQTTPYTNKAVIYGHVIGLSPEVSGRVIHVHTILKSQYVPAGTSVLNIDPKPYALKVKLAESDLVLAKAQVAQLTAYIKQMHAVIKQQQADYVLAQQHANEVQHLYKQGAASLSEWQQASATLKQAQAKLTQAQSSLKQAEAKLGRTHNGVNIHVQRAQQALALAQYYLSKTTLKTSAAGYVENLYVHAGDYASPGVTKIPFIVGHSQWIEGLVTGNAIRHIQLGQRALVVLDTFPGKVFDAKVTSIGHGVLTEQIKQGKGLPEYHADTSWIAQSALFPFGVNIDAKQLAGKTLRVGGNASVVVLNQGWFWNAWAHVVMWIRAWWAFV